MSSLRVITLRQGKSFTTTKKNLYLTHWDFLLKIVTTPQGKSVTTTKKINLIYLFYLLPEDSHEKSHQPEKSVSATKMQCVEDKSGDCIA